MAVYWKKILGVWLSFLCYVVIFGGGTWAAQDPWVIPIRAVDDRPMTLTTRVVFTREFSNAESGTRWETGFGDEKLTSPSVRLSWQPLGFAGVWSLQLATLNQQGRLSYVIPKPDHTYEAKISYDPVYGILMVAVIDLTADAVIHQDALAVVTGELVLIQGYAHCTIPGAYVESLQENRAFLPVALAWEVDRHRSQAEPLVLCRDEEVRLRLLPGIERTLPGTFLILGEDGTKNRYLLGEQIVLAGDREYSLDPLMMAKLPPGLGRLLLVHRLGGNEWVVATQGIQVGKVTVEVARVEFDTHTGTLRGWVEIIADGPLMGVQVVGRGTAYSRSLRNDQSYLRELELFCTTLDLKAGSQQLEFAVPLDADPLEVWDLQVETEILTKEEVAKEAPLWSGKVLVGVPRTLQEEAAVEWAQYRMDFLAEYIHKPANDTVAAQAMETMVLEGFYRGAWEDIDYLDKRRGGAAKWAPLNHLERLLEMARAYADVHSRYYKDPQMWELVMLGLEFWYRNRAALVNPGWVHNEITVPDLILDILILLDRESPVHLVDFVKSRLDLQRDFKDVGQNLPWRLLTHIKLAVLLNEPANLRVIYRRLGDEIRLAPDLKREEWRHSRWQGYVGLDFTYTYVEGIQVDYSFHQHGPMLHSGSYGMGFLTYSARLAYVARNTQLFPSESLANLVDMVLEGQQWMVWHQQFDYSVLGRAIAGRGSGNAGALLRAVQWLRQIPGVPREADLLLLEKRLRGEEQPLLGNRYFWTSDYMVHRRPGFMATIRMASQEAVATEIVSWMNMKGHLVADGCMYLYQDGKEYADVFVTWDWLRIPGTTTEQKALPVVERQHESIRGAGVLVGGVSDGYYGCAGMYLNRDSLSARKSWFIFDQEIVALGTDIRCPTNNYVVTTINQNLLRDQVYVWDSGMSIISEGEHSSDQWSRIYHDETGYILLEPATLEVWNGLRKGRWSDVDQNGPTAEVAQRVFGLAISHGQRPEDGGYQYVVVPAIDLVDFQAYTAEQLTVLSNTGTVQAVWHKGLHMLQCIFWNPGGLRISDGLVLWVDQPCLLMLQYSSQSVQVTVANFRDGACPVKVQLNRPLDGEDVVWDAKTGVSTITFRLPTGEYTGQSVTKHCDLR